MKKRLFLKFKIDKNGLISLYITIMPYLYIMRILLDIDGVMVPVSSWKPAELLNDGFSRFSNRAVANLQKIISETGASIVLTTSHKGNFSLAEWGRIFNARGICSRIERLDYNSTNLSRKEEILIWLNVHKNEDDFVIIDDDKSLNALPTQIKNKLILTSPMIGLTETDAKNAIDILLQCESTSV